MDINIRNTNTYFSRQNMNQATTSKKNNEKSVSVTSDKQTETPIFTMQNPINYQSQLALLNAYAYINITKTAKKKEEEKNKKETKKTPEFGTLWNEISQNPEIESFLNNELCYVEIDKNAENIFQAA